MWLLIICFHPLLPSGELFDKIDRQGRLSEEQARYYLRQLCDGMLVYPFLLATRSPPSSRKDSLFTTINLISLLPSSLFFPFPFPFRILSMT